jgi:hypothetical protein
LTAFPYSLRNAAQIVERHVAQLSSPTPANDEFVGMADFSVESIHDVLASNSESISGSVSSEGSHHPSVECFMAETSEGHISSTSDSGETPREVPVRAGAGGVRVPPLVTVASAPPQLGRPPIEQLQAWQHELEEARHGLEEERAQLEREIMQRRAEGGRTRARPHDVHR